MYTAQFANEAEYVLELIGIGALVVAVADAHEAYTSVIGIAAAVLVFGLRSVAPERASRKGDGASVARAARCEAARAGNMAQHWHAPGAWRRRGGPAAMS